VKNILLAVTGLSPQVITETLYALNQSGRSNVAVFVIMFWWLNNSRK